MIFTDENNEPILVVDADDFIRSELVCEESKGIEFYCHQPLVIKDSEIDLGSVIKMLKAKSDSHSDVPLYKDIILFWNDENKRIITAADLLGRLLKGI